MDYYAVLNVPKEASLDELKNAYRRLCLVYHPDKHTDAQKRETARELFSRIQVAYSVLSDPQKRAIYDTYGADGVAAGLEVAPYYGTTAEIKAEFEARKRRQEEERRQAMADAHVSMQVTIDATQVFAPTIDDFDSEEGEGQERYGLMRLLEDVEISGMSATQVIHTQLSELNTLRLSGTLVAKNGKGFGNLQVGLLRQHAADWQSEATLTVGTGRGIKLATEKNLSQNMQGRLELELEEITAPGIVAVFPAFAASVTRTLSTHVYSLLKYSVGAREHSLTAGLGYSTQSMLLTGSLRLGEPKTWFEIGCRRTLTDTTRLRLSLKAGLDSIKFAYGLERLINERDKIALAVELDTAEGVLVKLKYSRQRQTYTLPIWLCDQLLPEPVVYGTLVPTVVYLAVQKFWLGPYAARKAESARKEARRRSQALVAERRREAMAAVQLMQETLDRRIKEEEDVSGLIIEEALYGELVTPANSLPDENAVINVTVPLQCMVRDSQLITGAYSKSGLVGFYDPLPDEPKQLRVRYRFQGRMHQVTIDDKEELRIPCKKHIVP